MYTYGVVVKKKDGAIVSIEPESIKEPSEVAEVTLDISRIFFDIKELAEVNGNLVMDAGASLSGRQITQVIQLIGIIKEKTEEASQLLQAIDPAEE